MSNGDRRVGRPCKRFSAESRTSKQFDRSMRRYEPRKSVVVNKDNTSHYVYNFILLKNRDHPLEKEYLSKGKRKSSSVEFPHLCKKAIYSIFLTSNVSTMGSIVSQLFGKRKDLNLNGWALNGWNLSYLT